MSRHIQLGLAALIAVVLGAGIAAAVIRSGEEAPTRAAAPTTAAPRTTAPTTVPPTTAPPTTGATTTTTGAVPTTAPPSGLATGGAGEVAAGPTTPPTGIESALVPGLVLIGAGLVLWRARGQRTSS